VWDMLRKDSSEMSFSETITATLGFAVILSYASLIALCVCFTPTHNPNQPQELTLSFL
jgi:hypothetical protein